MEIKLTEERFKELEDIIKRYPERQAAVMPSLWLIQQQYGWVSIEAVKYISQILDLPEETIYGVLNFYTMYNKKPVGKYHLQVCTNVSCMLRGGYEILEQIENKLNIKAGETTDDKLFTVSEAECLGSCGTAPMMQMNDDYEEDLTKEKIISILEKLSNEK